MFRVAKFKAHKMIEWIAICFGFLQSHAATRNMRIDHDADDMLTERPLHLQHVIRPSLELIRNGGKEFALNGEELVEPST